LLMENSERIRFNQCLDGMLILFRIEMEHNDEADSYISDGRIDMEHLAWALRDYILQYFENHKESEKWPPLVEAAVTRRLELFIVGRAFDHGHN